MYLRRDIEFEESGFPENRRCPRPIKFGNLRRAHSERGASGRIFVQNGIIVRQNATAGKRQPEESPTKTVFGQARVVGSARREVKGNRDDAGNEDTQSAR